ncbi:hypothetical protein ES707_05326 [subsurface metagenome]
MNGSRNLKVAWFGAGMRKKYLSPFWEEKEK